MAATPPKLPPKPRNLHIPIDQIQNQTRQPSTPGTVHVNPLYIPSYVINNNVQPQTPATAMPQGNPYYNPFMYPGKASEFMFKQFEGFKDFTMNTAKSGLSVGEKCAFWMYNKVSAWSRKWFTHIFLFAVIMAYTAAGAAIFMAVEGGHKRNLIKDIEGKRKDLVAEFYELYKKPELLEDSGQFMGVAMRHLDPYEKILEQYIKQGYEVEEKEVWTFWNSVFYCGTIYTTIGE